MLFGTVVDDEVDEDDEPDSDELDVDERDGDDDLDVGERMATMTAIIAKANSMKVKAEMKMVLEVTRLTKVNMDMIVKVKAKVQGKAEVMVMVMVRMSFKDHDLSRHVMLAARPAKWSNADHVEADHAWPTLVLRIHRCFGRSGLPRRVGAAWGGWG